jgi:hypothetical protein
MDHEHNGPGNHQDALDSDIHVDELQETFEACTVLEKVHDFEEPHNTQETVESGQSRQSDKFINV